MPCLSNIKLLSLFDNFSNAPVFVFRQFARFYYSHLVADAALVIFVVSLELGGLGYCLFLEGMLALFGNGYEYGLIHFIGNYQAHSFLS